MSIHHHGTPSDDAGGHAEHRPENAEGPRSFWTSKAGLVAIGFILIAAFLLLSEHRAHALGYWPFLLLLACPFLHMFMHGGHGGHAGHGGGTSSSDPAQPPRLQREDKP